MAGDLVLITGVTGHVGFRALRYALEYGYRVRGVVRSEAKAETVRSNPALKSMNKDSDLTFVVVPDFLVPGAFDEAVKGVKYIIHIASPITTGVPNDADFEKVFIQPAVQGTLAMLESARKSTSVKRVIITASVLSMVPLTAAVGTDNVQYSADSRLPDIEPPYWNAFHAYSASKVAALNRAEAWVKNEKPSFDVIHIHPTFVYGREDLKTSTAEFPLSTNNVPLTLALGQTNPEMESVATSYTHVDDAARIHVRALDPRIAGNQSFMVSNTGEEGTKWEDLHAIVEKHFPEAVKKGILPNNTTYGNVDVKIDNRKTVEAFGKLASFEDTIVSVVGQYLELYDKEQKGGLKN